jgi:integrase
MSGSRRKPGRLGPFVEEYRAWLLGRGYTPSAAVRSLSTLGHLGRWLERNALAVDQLNAEVGRAFLVEYRSDHGRLPGASVWPLLEYLRAEGAVPPEPSARLAPVEQLVGEYREWLLCERGLAPVTVRASEQLARRFLAERVSPDDPRGVLGITAAEVNAFLVRECARVSTGSAGCCTYRLRSLLRYLAVRGLADSGLAVAVPRVARWRDAAIPQFPTRPQIDRLLGSCDRQQATGARDYAVLLLLARLGLRAVEVSRLRLDDLDWRAGLIIVDGKARRRDQLPLPGDVGEAIVEHLRHRGRRCGERRVFVTVHAPIRPTPEWAMDAARASAVSAAGGDRGHAAPDVHPVGREVSEPPVTAAEPDEDPAGVPATDAGTEHGSDREPQTLTTAGDPAQAASAEPAVRRTRGARGRTAASRACRQSRAARGRRHE